MCASLWAYDLLFFFVHVFMHKVPWVYRNVHAKHHNQVALASHEVIHHSFIDGSFQVRSLYRVTIQNDKKLPLT